MSDTTLNEEYRYAVINTRSGYFVDEDFRLTSDPYRAVWFPSFALAENFISDNKVVGCGYGVAKRFTLGGGK